MNTRRNNVVKYMNEWRDGSWYMRASQGIPSRVAEEVVSYSDLADTTANQRAYEATVAEMIADASLKVTYHEDLFITVELP